MKPPANVAFSKMCSYLSIGGALGLVDHMVRTRTGDCDGEEGMGKR